MLEFYPGRPKPLSPPRVPPQLAVLALVILIASSVARADTIRVKIMPSNGELVPFDKPPCDATTRAQLWRVVNLRPMVEIVDDRMTFVVGHKRKDADSDIGLSDFTYWDDGRGFVKLTRYNATFERPNDVAITISVLKSATVIRPRSPENGFVAPRARDARVNLSGMRGASISITSNGCTVRWVGLGEEI